MNSQSRTYLFLLLLLSFLTEIFSDDGFIVRLSHGGEIRGNTLKSEKGRTIYAFRGIPYAEPPIGERRFKAPISKSPWTDQPLDASKDGPSCPQVGLVGSTYDGEEDCLYLNVYTTMQPSSRPSNESATKLSVMAWIHGGAFVSGSSSSQSYGPGLLLDEDIVLVTMNYRLGPFGFLSTGDSASIGNYGLMDQSMALQWVKDNIHVFGGDHNKITIFGESAGAVSVGLHVMSPMSNGLFNAAIAQSGSALFQLFRRTHPVYWTKKLAADLECLVEDHSELVECLRGIPAVDLIKKASSHFRPTVGGPFLPFPPEEMIASGNCSKVPYLGGVNKDEGLISYVTLYLNPDISTLKLRTEAALKNMLDDRGNADEAAQLVMKKYLSELDWNDTEATRRAIVKMFSDANFHMVHYKTIKLLSQNGFRTFTYSLDYIPSVSIINIFGIKEKWGVSHADDLGFLFDGPQSFLNNVTDDDKKVRQVFCPLWANFAKYGDPTPNPAKDGILKWELSNNSKMNIYHIDNPVTTSTHDLEKDDLYNFWIDVIPPLLDKMKSS